MKERAVAQEEAERKKKSQGSSDKENESKDANQKFEQDNRTDSVSKNILGDDGDEDVIF